MVRAQAPPSGGGGHLGRVAAAAEHVACRPAGQDSGQRFLPAAARPCRLRGASLNPSPGKRFLTGCGMGGWGPWLARTHHGSGVGRPFLTRASGLAALMGPGRVGQLRGAATRPEVLVPQPQGSRPSCSIDSGYGPHRRWGHVWQETAPSLADTARTCSPSSLRRVARHLLALLFCHTHARPPPHAAAAVEGR